MEDSNDYDIEKDIPTIEELEKLGKYTAVPLWLSSYSPKNFLETFRSQGKYSTGKCAGIWRKGAPSAKRRYIYVCWTLRLYTQTWRKGCCISIQSS